MSQSDFTGYTGAQPLKPKWQERFAFFEAHGAPSSPAFREAFKALPRRKRTLINFNYFAFFFGPIYFGALGLWKKAASLLLLAVATGFIELFFSSLTGIDIPRAVDTALNIVVAMLFGYSANYAYYLKVVGQRQSWNPFEGMRLF